MSRDQILALVAKGAATGLFFSTDDCQASYEALKSRGVEFTQEPTEQPWGERVARVLDPDGTEVIIGARTTAG